MENLDVVWEEVLEKAGIADWESKPSAYVKINRDDTQYKNYSNCSHVLIYARTKTTSFNIYDRKAIILVGPLKLLWLNSLHLDAAHETESMGMMQVRFDGFLGFPGGVVDPGETPVEALNRELGEESGWFEEKGPIMEEHYLFSHADKEKRSVFNFYAIEVSEEKVKEIEVNTLRAVDYGGEVLGSLRVPLYTMEDSYSGFPSFLRNNFVGNAKIQLIEALVSLKLLTPESVMEALFSRRLIVT